MNDQLSFFGPEPEHGNTRHTDPWTSQAAAEQVNVSESERRIVSVLSRLGKAMITDEIAQWANLPLNNVSTRMKSLILKGLVYTAGTLPGPSGCEKTAYKAYRVNQNG